MITRKGRKQTRKALLTLQRNIKLESRRLRKSQRRAAKRGLQGLVRKIVSCFQ